MLMIEKFAGRALVMSILCGGLLLGSLGHVASAVENMNCAYSQRSKSKNFFSDKSPKSVGGTSANRSPRQMVPLQPRMPMEDDSEWATVEVFKLLEGYSPDRPAVKDPTGRVFKML